MNFLSLAALGQGMVYGLSAILAFVLVVFLHELGHFVMARLCGVTVEAFSIGFGPEIWGFRDRKGTRWKFSWIPLGGYVRFAGDTNAASMGTSQNVPGSLQSATIWRRALIVIAGPAANFLTAFAVFATSLFMLGSFEFEPRIDQVSAGGAAQQAGVQPGDVIRSIDGVSVTSFNDVQNHMVLHGTEPVALVLDRNGTSVSLTLMPVITQVDDGMGSKMPVARLGIVAKDTPHAVHYSLPQAVAKGANDTYFVAATTLRWIGQVVTGKQSFAQAHGPLSIPKAAGDAMMAGPSHFAVLIALISISVGLVNLFPIPMLDGGHLLFYLIEAIKGRPMSSTAQEWSYRIGLAFILMIFVLVTRNDLPLFGL